MGDILTIIVVLVVLGLVFYLIENYIPMDPMFRVILRVVVVIALCLWLLSWAGVIGGHGFRVRSALSSPGSLVLSTSLVIG